MAAPQSSPRTSATADPSPPMAELSSKHRHFVDQVSRALCALPQSKVTDSTAIHSALWSSLQTAASSHDGTCCAPLRSNDPLAMLAEALSWRIALLKEHNTLAIEPIRATSDQVDSAACPPPPTPIAEPTHMLEGTSVPTICTPIDLLNASSSLPAAAAVPGTAAASDPVGSKPAQHGCLPSSPSESGKGPTPQTMSPETRVESAAEPWSGAGGVWGPQLASPALANTPACTAYSSHSGTLARDRDRTSSGEWPVDRDMAALLVRAPNPAEIEAALNSIAQTVLAGACSPTCVATCVCMPASTKRSINEIPA